MGDFKPDQPEMMMHDEQDREPSPSGSLFEKSHAESRYANREIMFRDLRDMDRRVRIVLPSH